MPEIKSEDGQTETVSESALKTQRALESRMSIRTPFQTFAANGLTPSRLGLILRDAANWNQEQYMELAEALEERDAHYRSVIQTRKMAVTSLPWHVVPASKDARDIEIAEFCQGVLGRRGFNALMHDSLDALAKGMSAVEIVWSTDIEPGRMVPASYLWRDPRYFSYDYETMTQVQLRTDENPTYGEPLDPGKFIVHTPMLKSGKVPRSGLAYTVAALWIAKSYVLKDWLAFSEVFGMPVRVGKLSEAASEDERDALIRALAAIGSDAAAVISRSAELEMLGVNTTAHGDFYESAQRFFNQEISKAVLGQTMTTEDGSSLAQAKVHGEVRADIRNADAKSLAETITADLIGPLVQLNFGVDAMVPRFEFDISEPEDLTALATALVPFIDRGLRVDTLEIYSRFGLTQPAEGAEVLGEAPATSDVDVIEDEPPEPDEMPEDEEAMSARQAAEVLGLSVTHVYGLVSAGELRMFQKSGRTRFRAAEVKARAEAWASSPFAVTTTE